MSFSVPNSMPFIKSSNMKSQRCSTWSLGRFEEEGNPQSCMLVQNYMQSDTLAHKQHFQLLFLGSRWYSNQSGQASLVVSNYPDLHSQLRMDYITATLEMGLTNCLTKVRLRFFRHIIRIQSACDVTIKGFNKLHGQVISRDTVVLLKVL